MEKVLLNSVRIGILDNNGDFKMSPFIDGVKNYFQFSEPDNLGGISKKEVLGREFLNGKVNIFSSDEKIYVVESLANEYIEYLRKLYFMIISLVDKFEKKSESNHTGCKIFDLGIIAKIAENEIFVPPVSGLKFYGIGNISGHKYLKTSFAKTSKIVDIDYNSLILTSKRSVYKILSISAEYENYIKGIISELENMLDQY